MFKGAVIEKTSGIKQAFQLCFLPFIGPKPVFESFPHLLALLRLDIFANRFIGNMPDAPGVVTSTPKCRKSAFERSKFFSQYPARITFESVDNLRNASRGIMFDKHVNVIRHYFEGMNGKPKFSRFFVKKLLKSFSNFINEYLSPVFGTPDEVKFKAENSPGVFGVSVHIKQYTTARYLSQPLTLERCGFSSAT